MLLPINADDTAEAEEVPQPIPPTGPGQHGQRMLPLVALLSSQHNTMEADARAWLRDLQLAGPDMLIDGYEQYNQQNDQVVNITPDDHSDEAAESPVRADDCESTTVHGHCLLLMPFQSRQ